MIPNQANTAAASRTAVSSRQLNPVTHNDPDMTVHIINVEDEPAIRDMVKFALERHGHQVHLAATVSEAREQMQAQKMDLAIVDWMLPGGSGLEFVRALRKQRAYAHLPIIMLTAKTEEQDITEGLDAGADGYVTKPFSPRELQSRIKALLRRSKDFHDGEEITRGPLSIDLAAHKLTASGRR